MACCTQRAGKRGPGGELPLTTSCTACAGAGAGSRCGSRRGGAGRAARRAQGNRCSRARAGAAPGMGCARAVARCMQQRRAPGGKLVANGARGAVHLLATQAEAPAARERSTWRFGKGCWRAQREPAGCGGHRSASRRAARPGAEHPAVGSSPGALTGLSHTQSRPRGSRRCERQSRCAEGREGGEGGLCGAEAGA